MFENLPDYMKEIIISASEDTISKERVELYQFETRALAKLKRDFSNQFEEVIKNNTPTSIRNDI